MTDWYLAPSLDVLRAEINTRWPGRDRTSDGTIGDAAHQASQSDHNPNSRGSVDAIDVDRDGVDFATVFAAIKRHPSARYVIYERRLYHRLRGWKAEPYSGVNPHDKHFHLSIDQLREAEQDRRPWGLLEDDMTPEQWQTLQNVERMLSRLDGREPIGQAYLRLAVGKDHAADAQPVTHPTLTSLDQHLTALEAKLGEVADRPPVTVDYDQLAAALPPALAKQVADELAARLVA